MQCPQSYSLVLENCTKFYIGGELFPDMNYPILHEMGGFIPLAVKEKTPTDGLVSRASLNPSH